MKLLGLICGAAALVTGLLIAEPPAPELPITHMPSAKAIVPHKESPFVWPSGEVAQIARDFDLPAEPWLSGHRGVDLAMPHGSPVYAAGDGVVVTARTIVDRPVISIAHSSGIRTTYEPVEASVSVGQRVQAGEVIGYVVEGHRDEAERPSSRLHWGAKAGDEYRNPLSLLHPIKVRLWA